MPKYAVEMLNPIGDGFTRVCTFDAPDIENAIKRVADHVNSYTVRPVIIEQNNASALITTSMPFGQVLAYIVGETIDQSCERHDE